MPIFIIRDTTAIYIVTVFGALLVFASTICFIANIISGTVAFTEFMVGILSGGLFVWVGLAAWNDKKKENTVL